VHIPKTGGTSIEIFLRSNNYTESLFGLPFLDDPRFSIFYLNRTHLQHQPFTLISKHEQLLDLKVDNVDLFLTVVRNPYNRIMSELFWRHMALSTDSTDAIYDKLRVLISVPLRWGIEHVFQQHTFIQNEKNIIDERFVIVKTENLTNSLQQLGGVFSTFCCHTGRVETLKSQKSAPEYFNYLNENSIQLINNTYSRDFELFGYDML